MDENSGTSALAAVVEGARHRLRRIAGRHMLGRRGPVVFGLGLAAIALRPLLWPLGDEASLWVGLARAGAMGAVVVFVGLTVLRFLGRRRGPRALLAARALDEVGGHPEVVASGWAFAEDAREGAFIDLARGRAEEAAGRVDVSAAFPLPPLRPRKKTLVIFIPLMIVALAIGAYDPVRVAALLDPPTHLETEGAAVLAAAAERIAEAAREEARRETRPERARAPGRGRSRDERRESLGDLAERARRAARAAGRGDRERALSELREVGRAGRSRSARERALSRTLSRLSESLGGRPRSRSARSTPGAASESLRLLARRTREDAAREGTPEAEAERQRTLERLARAAESMREEAARTGSEEARRAAEELSRAAEELTRGDRRAAAEALERAAREARGLERQREAAGREAEALARLMEASGLLERAVQLAMAGRDGEGRRPMPTMGEGEGAGQGGASADEMAALRRALAERLASMGEGRPGTPGTGPGGHLPDRGDGARGGIEVEASTRARSDVGEGERATQAVRGLGQNGEPTHAYREIFPSYDAIAEEAMADEAVPPLRRVAVRRYFEGIRPGGGPRVQEDQEDREFEQQRGSEQ